ncbi:UNVERIFIED_CONTAM: hypothetical protein GTU68_031560 [Idotea baltica]|nr:hypothetical protein [Idotea baltica]
MRTPGDDEALIRGLLYAEDIYKKDYLKLKTIEQFDNGFSIINVTISKEELGSGYLNKRTLLSVSSCGICGKQKLEDVIISGDSISSKGSIKLSQLKILFKKMKTKQRLFQLTGGSHATAAFDNNGKLLSIKEDIGRHNALDKVIGDLLITNKIKEIACILVSGRVSYEIISKAFIAKIPVIVAVSACSTLAVDYAKEFGICLIGFNREDNATIYSNPQYLEI